MIKCQKREQLPITQQSLSTALHPPRIVFQNIVDASVRQGRLRYEDLQLLVQQLLEALLGFFDDFGLFQKKNFRKRQHAVRGCCRKAAPTQARHEKLI